jgi:hypothetical protein
VVFFLQITLPPRRTEEERQKPNVRRTNCHFTTGKDGDGAVSTRTRAQESPPVASGKFSTPYAQATVRAPLPSKGLCIPSVQGIFGRKVKGLKETASIFNLISQQYRNKPAEAGAITLPL